MFYSMILYFMMTFGLTGGAPVEFDGDSQDTTNRPEMTHRDDGGQSTGGGGR